MYKRIGKRVFDVLLTILGIALGAPLMGLIAFFVWIMLGWPVFFRQERPGLNGKLFTLIKFRTMTDSRDCRRRLLPDAERLTSFGRFLRMTSLDELPELINVFRGEMSLVGPRPLLKEYLSLYTREQERRHEVKPGITGMTQVYGRNSLTWEDKFTYDVWYVDHLSLRLDMRLLGLTLWKIFKREGISQPGQATMEKFRGSGGKYEGSI